MPEHLWPRLAGLAGVLALAGCGPGPQPVSAPETTTVPPVTTAPSSSATPVVDPYAGLPLIDRTEWTAALDGDRLLVFPTVAGRQTSAPGSDERAWQEVVTATPDADSPGMRDQFICHWVWARLVQPNKPSWNLEPWRPAVGYQATVDASCNPGGPER
ncbi:DUF2599 domain-containing protein [Nocardia sp. NPDC051832]|uniref:DUF2599 domain-containing protein n=1 Tax=Nocardia sp. NPDC051832 TaxID=3155673 RepID=UPI00341C563E